MPRSNLQEWTEKSDENLMDAYAHGNEIAFTALYERYADRLLNFLKRRLSASHSFLATDLFQVTWLKLHHHRKRFDPTKKFQTWLFTIAMNTLRDYLREARHQHETHIDQELSEQSQAEKMVLSQEILKTLDQALIHLSTAQREVILLSDWEGFQTKEIADMMKLSEGAVRQLLFRARSTLRPRLKGVKP